MVQPKEKLEVVDQNQNNSQNKTLTNQTLKLGLDPNEYSFDEQDIIGALQVVFSGEIMHTQYCVQNKRLFTFLNTNLEQKLMNMVMQTEILNAKKVGN